MPTPLGHSLAGLAIHLAGRNPKRGRGWPFLPLLVLLANFPDIDFIGGYLVGHPSAFHWGPTHSLIAALLVGGFAGALVGARTGRYAAAMVLTTAAYASHILLDLLFGRPRTPSVGLQVFWPFSAERFLLPWPVFKMAPISVLTSPLQTLLSRDILSVVARELMVMAPVVFVAWTFARFAQSRTSE